ncbi:hypothetical protein HMPREF1624_01239 [Sporothrix schenckii ATCC 58251]|uniref:Uncharacterized protein n=1 Tax=Sporothrix schenckii (strain ATCC 58251 / de Perez 2211183) TaxID=1391915 RepID=U7Q7E5_SPOS1|nr:hypothetical protein HMPREF1624_01239 [Sporothrix schenckii ATCC 58251]
MGGHQPFLYDAEHSSSSLPEKPFDPKAVTRASWQAKPVKPKQEGPLVQLNRHPDAHEVIGGQRKPVKTMSSTTKAWIKAIRVVQLLIRALQFLGATAILVLVILITGVPGITTWVLRITAGFVIAHSAYGVYHHSKPAGYRTPASSGAYQVFAAFSDLSVLPLYAYGAMSAKNNSAGWTTLLTDQTYVPYLVTSFYYTLIGSGGLHGLSLVVSFWLALKFRQIAQMPPDMNPLEDRYTTRSKKRQQKQLKDMQKQQHARNKSSIATADTFESLSSLDNDKGLLSRPPSVPFLHTRTGSQATISSSDPRLTLPSQNSPSSNSARSSLANLKRSSMVNTPNSGRGSYAEVPLNDGGYANSPSSRLSYHSGRPSSRPQSGTPNSSNSPAGLGITDGANGGGRPGKFTETWQATDSMVNRTQQRNAALNTMVLNASGKRRNYEVVSQAYDFHDSEGEVSDTDTVHRHDIDDDDDENAPYNHYSYDDGGDYNRPNPLRSNPTLPRTKTPFRQERPASTVPSMTSSVHTSTTYNGNVLGEVPINDRRVSGGYTVDIADAMKSSIAKDGNSSPTKDIGRGLTKGKLSPQETQQKSDSKVSRTPTKRWTWAPRSRQSSVQKEDDFYSKPYGQLKSATPPIMVGKDLAAGSPSGTRQVSSGNDYDLGSDRYLYYGDNNAGVANTFSRRNVSGKIAEEGRAFNRYSTYNN